LGIAITNLLDNATKYSAPGGEVSIRLARLTSGLALVVIENDGQGIPNEHISRIKRPRERYEPPGLPDDLGERREGGGIGLAMAEQFVEDHGGWLDIRSYPLGERYRDDPRDHWRTVVTVAVPPR
jgi:signal transduction histidine kinase